MNEKRLLILAALPLLLASCDFGAKTASKASTAATAASSVPAIGDGFHVSGGNAEDCKAFFKLLSDRFESIENFPDSMETFEFQKDQSAVATSYSARDFDSLASYASHEGNVTERYAAVLGKTATVYEADPIKKEYRISKTLLGADGDDAKKKAADSIFGFESLKDSIVSTASKSINAASEDPSVAVDADIDPNGNGTFKAVSRSNEGNDSGFGTVKTSGDILTMKLDSWLISDYRAEINASSPENGYAGYLHMNYGISLDSVMVYPDSTWTDTTPKTTSSSAAQ